MPTVVIEAEELKGLIATAVREGIVEGSRLSAAQIERVTGNQAAGMVGRRRSLITAACESGSLVARRRGRHWSIAVRDLDAWATAGFPITKE